MACPERRRRAWLRIATTSGEGGPGITRRLVAAEASGTPSDLAPARRTASTSNTAPENGKKGTRSRPHHDALPPPLHCGGRTPPIPRRPNRSRRPRSSDAELDTFTSPNRAARFRAVSDCVTHHSGTSTPRIPASSASSWSRSLTSPRHHARPSLPEAPKVPTGTPSRLPLPRQGDLGQTCPTPSSIRPGADGGPPSLVGTQPGSTE